MYPRIPIIHVAVRAKETKANASQVSQELSLALFALTATFAEQNIALTYKLQPVKAIEKIQINKLLKKSNFLGLVEATLWTGHKTY